MKKHCLQYTLFLAIIFITTYGDAFAGPVEGVLTGIVVGHAIIGRQPLLIDFNCNTLNKEHEVKKQEEEIQKATAILKIREVKDRRFKKNILGFLEEREVILNDKRAMDKVLINDLVQVFRDNNYIVVNDESETASLLLDIKIFEVWSQSLFSRIIFRVEFFDKESGKNLWSKTFSGVDKLNWYYMTPGRFTDTFNKTYCRTIDSFAEAVKSDDFKRAVQQTESR